VADAAPRLQVLERYLAAGGTAKAAAFSAAVLALAVGGQLNDALAWRRRMTERGLTGNADLHTGVRPPLASLRKWLNTDDGSSRQAGGRREQQLMAAAFRTGENATVLALFHEMDAKGITPEPLAFAYAIAALHKQGSESDARAHGHKRLPRCRL